MGTLVRSKNIFVAISLVKLNHSHRKYSRKKFYRRIFLKCITLLQHTVARSTYYLIQTIPFLGIPKVAWNFLDCRNCKLIKCGRDWHKQMVNQCFNILTPKFCATPSPQKKEICAISSLLQPSQKLFWAGWAQSASIGWIGKNLLKSWGSRNLEY